MNTILLITTLFFLTAQSIGRRIYTDSTGGAGVYTYAVFTGIGALVFFLVTAKDLTWDMGILPYSVIFALSYLTAGIFATKAISAGSLSLTSLISSCSLIIPTFYSLFFLDENGSPMLYAGIALLIFALVLVNKTSESMPITGKWLICVSISFVGNGMCSLTQKLQQYAFNGAGKNELMIIALIIVIAGSIIMTVITERKKIIVYTKHSALNGLICGVANGIVNMLVMVLLGRMPASVVFPLISGGGIVLTHAVSRTFYKEKLSRRQTFGFILGILSIVLLNL